MIKTGSDTVTLAGGAGDNGSLGLHRQRRNVDPCQDRSQRARQRHRSRQQRRNPQVRRQNYLPYGFANVAVASGGALDLNGFSDSVRRLDLAGTGIGNTGAFDSSAPASASNFGSWGGAGNGVRPHRKRQHRRHACGQHADDGRCSWQWHHQRERRLVRCHRRLAPAN